MAEPFPPCTGACLHDACWALIFTGCHTIDTNVLCPYSTVVRVAAADRIAGYVLTGGLGGFGLALAAWMVQRGARSLLLTSKRGLRTGAQAKAVRQLRSAGAEVGSPRLSCALSRPTSVAHVLLQRMHACTVLLRSPVSVCLPACSLWS